MILYVGYRHCLYENVFHISQDCSYTHHFISPIIGEGITGTQTYSLGYVISTQEMCALQLCVNVNLHFQLYYTYYSRVQDKVNIMYCVITDHSTNCNFPLALSV